MLFSSSDWKSLSLMLNLLAFCILLTDCTTIVYLPSDFIHVLAYFTPFYINPVCLGNSVVFCIDAVHICNAWQHILCLILAHILFGLEFKEKKIYISLTSLNGSNRWKNMTSVLLNSLLLLTRS